MTNLRDFLENTKVVKEEVTVEKVATDMVTAQGTFVCQDNDCEETVLEGYLDRVHNRIHWTCSNGHDSSVVI
jgi:restriction endonuclease Mrr